MQALFLLYRLTFTPSSQPAIQPSTATPLISHLHVASMTIALTTPSPAVTLPATILFATTKTHPERQSSRRLSCSDDIPLSKKPNLCIVFTPHNRYYSINNNPRHTTRRNLNYLVRFPSTYNPSSWILSLLLLTRRYASNTIEPYSHPTIIHVTCNKYVISCRRDPDGITDSSTFEVDGGYRIEKGRSELPLPSMRYAFWSIQIRCLRHRTSWNWAFYPLWPC